MKIIASPTFLLSDVNGRSAMPNSMLPFEVCGSREKMRSHSKSTKKYTVCNGVVILSLNGEVDFSLPLIFVLTLWGPKHLEG